MNYFCVFKPRKLLNNWVAYRKKTCSSYYNPPLSLLMLF